MFFIAIVLMPLFLEAGSVCGALEEDIQLVGFSVDGDFAAVRKTFALEEMSDKAAGTATRYSLDYIIRLSDGEVMGVYQGEAISAKSFSGGKEKIVKPGKAAGKQALPYILAAPMNLFKKAAKILGIPGEVDEAPRYPLTFIVPDKGVEASKTDKGIKAMAVDDGKHKVRIVLENPGKKSRTVGRWYVEKKTKSCACCADKTESRTETLDLDLYWGPAVPLVLWKRTVVKLFCPDVQTGKETIATAGWTAIEVR
jgi:hypothetical protein